MSEQEKKSGGGAGGSSVVLVESAASRQKQPFRPTELQEEAPDLHHKRSRAPAVPCKLSFIEMYFDTRHSTYFHSSIKFCKHLLTLMNL